MSTREIAHRIVDNLNEEQLTGFISLFGVFNTELVAEGKSEKERAYEELRHMIKPVPGLDYEKELAEYREGKYGI